MFKKCEIHKMSKASKWALLSVALPYRRNKIVTLTCRSVTGQGSYQAREHDYLISCAQKETFSNTGPSQQLPNHQ